MTEAMNNVTIRVLCKSEFTGGTEDENDFNDVCNLVPRDPCGDF